MKQGVDEIFAYDGLNRQVSRIISGSPPTPPDPSPTPTATPVATATPTASPTPPQTEQCKEVTFSGTSSVTMQTATVGATIFYTVGSTNGIAAPTHNGGTAGPGTNKYTGSIAVPFRQVKHFKALAYHDNMVDSKVTYYMADNSFDRGGAEAFSSQSMIPPSSESFYYVYDGWTLIAEYPGSALGYPTTYLPGIKNLTTNQYYYHDGLGSVTHLTDGTGHLIESYRYDLHGKPMFYSVTGQPLGASTVANRFLFTGQQWYSELGLYDLRNRFYSPDTGRFVQADPIGFAGDATNLYRYVGNNAVNGSDPSGLQDAVNRRLDEQGVSSGGSVSTPINPEGATDPAADIMDPYPIVFPGGSARSSGSTSSTNSSSSTSSSSVTGSGGGTGAGLGGPGLGPGGLGSGSTPGNGGAVPGGAANGIYTGGGGSPGMVFGDGGGGGNARAGVGRPSVSDALNHSFEREFDGMGGSARYSRFSPSGASASEWNWTGITVTENAGLFPAVNQRLSVSPSGVTYRFGIGWGVPPGGGSVTTGGQLGNTPRGVTWNWSSSVSGGLAPGLPLGGSSSSTWFASGQRPVVNVGGGWGIGFGYTHTYGITVSIPWR